MDSSQSSKSQTGNILLDTINIDSVIEIAKRAGDAIMAIYHGDFSVEYKEDRSPLTEADQRSNEIICAALDDLFPDIPLLSEENRIIPYEERKVWEYYWCIDPLDGTKEFVRKRDEFTVNIALIFRDTPVLGVVYAPVPGDMYFAKKGSGAWKVQIGNPKYPERLPLKLPRNRQSLREELFVLASKSHLSRETEVFIDTLSTISDQISIVSKGSSLKLCMVAEGQADIYPRLSPTMEWDTAAADAIVREAGMQSYQYNPKAKNPTLKPLVYNKKNLLNPWFVVCGKCEALLSAIKLGDLTILK